MEKKFQVQLKIGKPISEVFQAVVDPKKLTTYFVKDSSGPLTPGETVEWKFAEVPDPVEVVVDEVVTDERITFDWKSPTQESANQVEMEFKPIDSKNTLVLISEGPWPDTPEGLKASYNNAGGWMHMMCCLQARLEFDIHLRAGASQSA